MSRIYAIQISFNPDLFLSQILEPANWFFNLFFIFLENISTRVLFIPAWWIKPQHKSSRHTKKKETIPFSVNPLPSFSLRWAWWIKPLHKSSPYTKQSHSIVAQNIEKKKGTVPFSLHKYENLIYFSAELHCCTKHW